MKSLRREGILESTHNPPDDGPVAPGRNAGRRRGKLRVQIKFTGGAHHAQDYIAKEIQMEANEFFELHENLLADRDWCREFSNRLHPMKDGAVPAIRVTCRGSLTVMIIDPQGHDYPRYVGLEYEE